MDCVMKAANKCNGRLGNEQKNNYHEREKITKRRPLFNKTKQAQRDISLIIPFRTIISSACLHAHTHTRLIPVRKKEEE